MADRIATAQHLDRLAAEETSLARSQVLAAEADRLRRAEAASIGGIVSHLLRN